MNKTGNKCIECEDETFAIQIIDRGQRNIHYELVYTTGDAKSVFGKGYPIEGKVSPEL